MSNVDTKEDELKNIINKMAEENKVTQESVIEALKMWLKNNYIHNIAEN